jgi:hypothetical protein
MLQESAIDDSAIEAIRNCSLELLDSEYPPVKEVFLRTYGGNKKEKKPRSRVSSFQRPPASSRELLE